MSEIPTPQPDPNDLSDDQKKELIGIEFSSVLARTAKDRYQCLESEMHRHGFDPDSQYHHDLAVKEELRKVYELEESDTIIDVLDGMAEVGALDIDLVGIGVELKELVDVRFEFKNDLGIIFEQIVKNVGEQGEYLRWTMFFINDGKLFARSINSDIEELGNTEDEHHEHINSRLAEVIEEENLLGSDELSVQDASRVVKVVKEISGILNGFYSSVAISNQDLGNWRNGPSMN